VPSIAVVWLGAFLLFLVQPMAARFILPWFGGAPTVWSACLLFFQIALLAGYAYAHLTRRLTLSHQARLHVALLVAAMLTLPIVPSPMWKPADADAPALRILVLLAATVGAPYFMLAATAPLLQDWFARAGSGRAPYRLYAWSNAGSLLALLAYPLVVEPFLPLQVQARAWSILFVLFCAICAWTSLRLTRPAHIDGEGGEERAIRDDDPRVATGDVALWVLLSACGSGLLLAVTNQLCENLAVVPLLWIVPLVVYLVTFIVCFAGGYRRAMWAPLLPAVAGGAAWALRLVDYPLPLQVGTVSAVLLTGCMVCHGELVRIRPHASRLTSFYLAVAAGGSLGGLSVALAAPAFLNRLWEFPFFTVLSLLLFLIALYRDPSSRLRGGARPIAWAGLSIAFGAAAVAFVRPPAPTGTEIARTRNFYGILSVEEDASDAVEPRIRRLLNGRILHGAQILDPERKTVATTYYGEGSGVELAIRQHPRRLAAQPMRIGVVGLGAGTIAVWGETGDTMRFFEINPAAETYARQYFTFLADSRAAIDVGIGDARLAIERELREPSAVRAYDVLAIDAFAGDAIPVHLLTREAFALYAAAMEPDGVLALHVSNRYLDLPPVVRGLAAEQGREVLEIEQEDDAWNAGEASTWMLVTRNDAFVAAVRSDAQPPQSGARSIVWTDAFSSLLPLLKKK
jgi:spermidine synthase